MRFKTIRIGSGVFLGSSAAFALIVAAACSAGPPKKELTTVATSTSTGGTDAAGGNTSTNTTGAGGFLPTGSGGMGGSVIPCENPADDADFDKDGYTITAGDCNDCDANVNPGAVEAPTKKGEMPFDEDCDKEVDEQGDVVSCDDDLVVDEADPAVAAKAVGICKVSTGVKDWGLVSAKWVMPDGTLPPVDAQDATNFHLGHGVLTAFGNVVKVREGKRMLALSSGTARQPLDPGYKSPQGFSKDISSGHPVGFPKESPACPGTITGEPNDGAGIELELRAPTNAHGIGFEFDFFTYEWPNYVCSKFNDFFVALLEPFPPKQQDGNISFDAMGNPISVNNAFLDVCGCEGNPPSPCEAGGKFFNCALGNAELLGTGFGFDAGGSFAVDHGSTSWLSSQAPIPASGQKDSVIKLRWGVYDSGDGALDTTTLIDKFRWILEAGVPVVTEPVPR